MSDFTWWVEPAQIDGTDVCIGGGDMSEGGERIGLIIGDTQALLTVRQAAALIAQLSELFAAIVSAP